MRGIGKRKLAAILVAIASLMSVGCGAKAVDTSGVSSATSYAATTCAAGYTYNYSYGCVYSGTSGTSYGAGCVPLAQSIPFYGTGLTVDGGGSIYGGNIPGNSTYAAYGTMAVGSTTAVSGTTYVNQSAGVLQLSVASGTTAGTTTPVTGSLTISAAYQQAIQSYAASLGVSSGYSSACISGIAIQGRLYATSGAIFSGQVYVYLNGTQHGYVLPFY
jgi:hypothetical protein